MNATMNGRDRRVHRVWTLPLAVASLVTVLALAPTWPDAAPLGATLLFVGGDRYRSTTGLLGAIAAGALGLGAVAWLVATQTAIVAAGPTLVTGLGLAVGGGLGSLVWLLGLGERGAQEADTVTVEMDGDDASEPDPEPVDLFEANPDPICFYAEAPDGPVVRAVNPAFERVFGVSSAALDGEPLADGALVVDDGAALVEAARAGRSFDEVCTCETADGERAMRVRIAATGRGRSDGYVLYSPVPDAD